MRHFLIDIALLVVLGGHTIHHHGSRNGFVVVEAVEITTTTTKQQLPLTPPVTCIVEYSMNAKPIQLSVEQMNDGYCDCIWTGDDEPNTMACSGYASWPGTTLLQPNAQQDARYVFSIIFLILLLHIHYLHFQITLIQFCHFAIFKFAKIRKSLDVHYLVRSF
jgi:hypothetical protein